MVIVVMGASGAGKTTVGSALAFSLGWEFLDADSLHAADAIAQMVAGVPLTDADREPWLRRVHTAMTAAARAGRDLVVACSALRERYRRVLESGVGRLAWIFLMADATLLHQRLAKRTGHFMPESLVDSQLATLEPPHDAIRINAADPVNVQVDTIRRALKLER
jgi:gluconokinase